MVNKRCPIGPLPFPPPPLTITASISSSESGARWKRAGVWSRASGACGGHRRLLLLLLLLVLPALLLEEVAALTLPRLLSDSLIRAGWGQRRGGGWG